MTKAAGKDRSPYPRTVMVGALVLRQPACPYVVTETSDEIFSVTLYSGYDRAGVVDHAEGLYRREISTWLIERLDY
jgi:hypothetical protein